MPWWLRGLLRNGSLTVADYTVTDGLDVQAQPAGGAAGGRVVRRAVAVDAPGLEQAVVLFKLAAVLGVVNAVGAPTAAFDHRETRDVAGTIGDINHVLKGDATVLGFDVGVNIDCGVFVRALVDFEQCARLGGVIDDHADLSDDGISIELYFALLEEAGLEGVLDKFAAPDPFHLSSNRATADHFGEAGAHDVVLQLDLVFAIFGFFADVTFGEIEKLWETGVKRDISAIGAEHAVVETTEFTREHVGEDVVEVANLAGEVVAALAVVFNERIGLGPEDGFINAVAAKERSLHVAGD